MAVAPMLKVTVIGYRPVLEDVVEALQGAGVVQVIADTYDLPCVEVSSDSPDLRATEEALADAQFVVQFLRGYHTPDHRFSMFISEKFHLENGEYASLTADERFRMLYKECLSLADRIAAGDRETERLRALVRDLEPWQGFRRQISEWRGTDHVALFTGTVPATAGGTIRQVLREAVSEVSVDEQGPIGTRQAWVVMAHRDVLDRVRAALATTEFEEVSFQGLADYPAEELACTRDRLTELAAERDAMVERARELGDEHYGTVFALEQRLESDRDALVAPRQFGRTQRAFLVSGWTRESAKPALEAALAPLEGDVDLALSPPAEGDVVPVELDNPRLLQPFEILTDLYGRPRYGDLDPTPFLAPFFLGFFAITISDVGYGAMLILGGWLVKTKLDVAPGVKKFMDLIMLGGAGAMVVGVLFGAYFALPIESLPAFLQRLQVLDPLNGLLILLELTIGLGVVQVFTGVAIAAYSAFRRGDAEEAVFGQLSIFYFWLMIFLATTPLIFPQVPDSVTRGALVLGIGGTMIMQGRAIQRALRADVLAPWDRWLGVGWVVLTVGWLVTLAVGSPGWAVWVWLAFTVVGLAISQATRGAVVGLLGGAYSVYGMTGFFGDVLSYTRLAALALSGALVGSVFNILARLVWGPAESQFARGGIGWLIGALIVLGATAVFVFGHTFNVVINLLSAFVHPARLQFVEFFSKFYEAGGKPFSPFRVRSKQLVLDAGATGEKGGSSS